MGKPRKKFSGPVLIEKGAGKYAILARDLTYWDSRSRAHTAKRGLKTNGMSGWRFALALIGCSPFGKALQACVINDHYWTRAEDLPERKDRLELRLKADLLFREMLKVLGFGLVRRRIIYRAVRMASRFYK